MQYNIHNIIFKIIKIYEYLLSRYAAGTSVVFSVINGYFFSSVIIKTNRNNRVHVDFIYIYIFNLS